MTNQFEQYIQEGMRRAMRESMQKMHDDMRRPPVSDWNARGTKCIFCGCDMSQTHKANCDTLNHDGKLLTN